jgi:NAD dependent epimerase/dehydratase family enzyme
MRLLLLGCTGFVGKELVPTLLNKNHEIYIVSRKPISKFNLYLDLNNFKFFQIYLSKEKNWNNENLLNILRETDGFINLMGEPIAEKKMDF